MSVKLLCKNHQKQYLIAGKIRSRFTNKFKRRHHFANIVTRETPFPIHKDEADIPNLL
jgi:hypothetical protein